MSAKVPAALSEAMALNGASGRAWLEALPGLIESLARRWRLDLGEPFEGPGSSAWVAPAGTVDGLPAVLKVAWPYWDRPHGGGGLEARTEAAGLRFFDGVGAVRLLRADEEVLALVEERCEPGQDLWTLESDEADAVAAAVLRRLWRPPGGSGGFEDLANVVADWIVEFPSLEETYGADVVHKAVEIAADLSATAEAVVVLHGDFNPGNVLNCARGWLAIDPKPVVGEPAFDLAQWVANRMGIFTPEVSAEELAPLVENLAAQLELDPHRIAGWSLVKSIGWRWGRVSADTLADLVDLV